MEDEMFGLYNKIGVEKNIYTLTQCMIHTPLQVTICSHSTDDALHIFHASTVNQTCNF